MYNCRLSVNNVYQSEMTASQTQNMHVLPKLLRCDKSAKS